LSQAARFQQAFAEAECVWTFGATGQLAQPECYPVYLAPVFRVFVRLPVATSYWDSQLKENGVYEQRFARPFER